MPLSAHENKKQDNYTMWYMINENSTTGLESKYST